MYIICKYFLGWIAQPIKDLFNRLHSQCIFVSHFEDIKHPDFTKSISRTGRLMIRASPYFGHSNGRSISTCFWCLFLVSVPCLCQPNYKFEGQCKVNSWGKVDFSLRYWTSYFCSKHLLFSHCGSAAWLDTSFPSRTCHDSLPRLCTCFATPEALRSSTSVLPSPYSERRSLGMPQPVFDLLNRWWLIFPWIHHLDPGESIHCS